MHGLNKQLFILYVHTRMRVCQTYIIVFQPHSVGCYTLFYRHFNEYPVSFTLILVMKRLQCRDTKIEISDEVLIQSRRGCASHSARSLVANQNQLGRVKAICAWRVEFIVRTIIILNNTNSIYFYSFHFSFQCVLKRA